MNRQPLYTRRRRAVMVVLLAFSAFSVGLIGRAPLPPKVPLRATPLICRRSDFPAGTNPCPVP